MSHFNELQNEIKRNLQQAKKLTNNISIVINRKHLDSSTSKRITSTLASGNEIFQIISQKLQELQRAKASEFDQKSAAATIASLKEQIQTAAKEFQEVQNEAKLKLTEVLRKERTVSVTRTQSIRESQQVDGVQTQAFATLQAEEDAAVKLIQEREEALLKLEVAQMVNEQGEKIDVIEEQIEDTNVAVEEANTDLKQAVVYKKAAGRKKIYILCILIAVLVTVGVVILIVKLV